MHFTTCVALTASVLVFSGGGMTAVPDAEPGEFSGLECFFKNDQGRSYDRPVYQPVSPAGPLFRDQGDPAEDDDEVIHDRNQPARRHTSRPDTPTAPGTGRFFQDETSGTRSERCAANNFCQTVWKVESVPGSNETVSTLAIAGCMPDQGYMGDKCGVDICVSYQKSRIPGKSGHTLLCCCTGNLCNLNYTAGHHPDQPERTTTAGNDNATAFGGATAAVIDGKEAPTDAGSFSQTAVIVGIIACLAMGLVVVLVVVLRRYRTVQKPEAAAAHAEDGLNDINLGETFPGRIFPADQSPLVAADVTILDKLAFGRYGEVYKATVGRQTVAVKKFSPKDRIYFLNECRIYSLPFMEHDAVLKFLAATEVRDLAGSVTEYWLVVEYHPNRTLTEYLKQNTVVSANLAAMALSLASGLAHLHLECTRDGVSKPGVVHRDLNSRNILVRGDMRLCICDMGFAMQNGSTGGSESASPESSVSSAASADRHGEPPLLNDVGTVRYMAPEVLEGSLNLRDSAAALRQVDVYAFGLVLWEMATRCSDIYQGGPVAEYQLPFQKEVGLRPTFSVMQNLVAKKKARPLFSEFWKANNTMVRFLKDTMEECWDGDAEARLTAKCVEERLLELTGSLGPPRIVNNLEQQPAVSPLMSPSAPLDEEEPSETMVLLSTVDETVRVPAVKNVNELRDGTLNITIPVAPRVVQPHQGRNPCFERNIKPESSEELTSSGNNLIGKKTGLRKNPSPPELSAGTRNRVIENAESALLGHRSHGAGNSNNERKGRQKKVPNVLAAEQNKSGFFGFFKKSSDSSNLLKYRVPGGGGGPLPGSNSIPATIPMTLDGAGTPDKCNILAAAKLLPHMLHHRGGGAPLHEGSNSTQLTCLSPSPSTSGSSPPQRARQTRESTMDADDLARFSPAPPGLIDIPPRSL